MLKQISLSLALAVAVVAAQPALAQNAQPQAHSAAEIQKIFDQIKGEAAKADNHSANHILDKYDFYYILMVARTATGEAERHQEWADQMFIVQGSLTLVTGGKITGEHPTTAGEFRGSGIEGGTEHVYHPGDMVHVPIGLPHWVKLAPNTTVSYYAFKQKS